MKTKLIAAGFSLLLASASAQATAIDLGPSRIYHYRDGELFTRVPTLGLDGRAFDGPTISFNITFGGDFIRTFHDTGSLFTRTNLVVAAGVPFPTNYYGFNVGSAYYLNKNGGKESNRFPLIASFESVVGGDVSDLAVWGEKALRFPPRDVYGFHFDINFVYPGLVLDEERLVTNSFGTSFFLHDSVEILATGKYKKNSIFGVGPNLPADIVPESGSAVTLLLMALAGMTWFNWKQKPQHVAAGLRSRKRPLRSSKSRSKL
jgi:hypothetical protein